MTYPSADQINRVSNMLLRE